VNYCAKTTWIPGIYSWFDGLCYVLRVKISLQKKAIITFHSSPATFVHGKKLILKPLFAALSFFHFCH
jgi:hypothetical protein